MKNYREVLQFTFNGDVYNMYLDNKNKRFFLKSISDGKKSYLNIFEYVSLVDELLKLENVMNIKKNNKKSIRIIPKVMIGGTASLLSFVILGTSLEMYRSNKRLEEFEANYNLIAYENEQIEKITEFEKDALQRYIFDENEIEKITEIESEDTQKFISYENKVTEEEAHELIVDTYQESEQFNYLFIYDMKYLDKIFMDDKPFRNQDIYETIQNNSRISQMFKKLLNEYVNAVLKKYPDIELRVFNKNIETLEVEECDKYELIKHTLSVDALACYVRQENKIYVLKGYNFEYGTWDYQVISHEFSHCLRTGYWNIDGKKVKVQAEGQNFYNTITSEALNSLFTVSLFDYEERDIAYQLQSNYHKVMIDCMDNYDLSDYVNHSISYYAKKLDEFNEDENYATVILELIQMQYDEYSNHKITTEPSAYEPIYDYICNMYFKKYITTETTYDEAKELTNQLVEQIIYDVPEDYNIPITYFYEYMDKHLAELGISSKKL